MTIVEAPPGITGGVDTHLEVHVAAALDPLGRLHRIGVVHDGHEGLSKSCSSGCAASATSPRSVSRAPGPMAQGSRGSSAPGRPRSSRSCANRRLAGTRARPTPSTRSKPHARRSLATGKGPREDPRRCSRAIRALVVAKRSARQGQGQGLVQCATWWAPDELSPALQGLSVPALIEQAASMRPDRSPDPVTAATKSSLSSLATRVRFLDTELASLDEQIASLFAAAVPELLARSASGPTPQQRCSSQPATTPSGCTQRRPGRALCGVSAHPRGSGKVTGHRRLTPEATVKPTVRCGGS